MFEWIAAQLERRNRYPKFFAMLARVPLPLAALLCQAAGSLLYVMERDTRASVVRNMRELMPGRSRLGCHLAALRYFQNAAFIMYELLVLTDRLVHDRNRRFHMEGEEHLRKALEVGAGKGVILYTPHMGNFFHYYWVLSQSYRMFTVGTQSAPELKPLYDLFERLGCRGFDYDTTPPLRMLRTFRKEIEQGGTLFMMGDFYRPSFPQIRWFNRKTRLPGGTAALASEMGVPVIPFRGIRVSGFRHVLRFGAPMIIARSEYDADKQLHTEKLAATLQQLVLEAPEHWLYWFNADTRWEQDQEEG